MSGRLSNLPVSIWALPPTKPPSRRVVLECRVLLTASSLAWPHATHMALGEGGVGVGAGLISGGWCAMIGCWDSAISYASLPGPEPAPCEGLCSACTGEACAWAIWGSLDLCRHSSVGCSSIRGGHVCPKLTEL